VCSPAAPCELDTAGLGAAAATGEADALDLARDLADQLDPVRSCHQVAGHGEPKCDRALGVRWTD
jgi:hypothetical protein